MLAGLGYPAPVHHRDLDRVLAESPARVVALGGGHGLAVALRAARAGTRPRSPRS